VSRACDACLARTWLLARLAGHIDLHRDRVDSLLELDSCELITALAGKRRATVERELERFEPDRARCRAVQAGLEQICRCDPGYPRPLAQLPASPAVLHVTGAAERFLGLADRAAVAVVGTRRPSPYGIDVARALARGLAAAGVTVVSGMALGIDSAAHRGALDGGGGTIAVLAGAAERPYPVRARALHRRIQADGAVVSELPPGVETRRWMFPARNRVIAALSALTVVVEARPGSGALLTAAHAARLGRPLGAVPGRVTSPLARGPHALLRDGAQLIEGAEDVFDGLFGAGRGDREPPARPSLEPPSRRELDPELQTLLDALAEGRGQAEALAHAGLDADRGLAALASLELAGRIRHEPGGHYSVLP
jgi:DNA processing protein